METRQKKVSIGMPVYNGELFIEDSINSILNQTFCNFELIISDNFSTDGTEELCRNLVKLDDRIKYYRNTVNVGIAGNYNAVFHYSQGAYFKWASANDICKEKFLSNCVEVLESNPDVVLCYPRTRLFEADPDNATDYDDGLDLRDESAFARFCKFTENIKLNNVMYGVFRSSCLRKTALNKKYFGSDISMMAELTLYGKFYEIPQYLFYRRIAPNASTTSFSREELTRYYNPTRSDRMMFQNWQKSMDNIFAAWRSPIAFQEKRKIIQRILRHMAWNRNTLRDEVTEYVGFLFRRH